MPASMPMYTLTAPTAPIPMMTIVQTKLPEANPKVSERPELSCIAAKAKEVANPKTVARMATTSTTRPAPRRIPEGNTPTTASRKVIGARRLWKEMARQSATVQ